MTADRKPPRAELLALAERCEKAEGPDRALDSSIAAALGWPDAQFTGQARTYTSSLDAALTLVPEGWRWWVNWRHARCWTGWRFDEGGHTSNEDDWRSVNGGPAATPAVALCAAALRARAEEADD